jgi:hypothetical protein
MPATKGGTTMPWRMKIVGKGHELFQVPVYLEDFDLEFRGGLGKATLTADPSKALPFETLESLFETWSTISRTKPRREDGRPNRPLTAYSFEPEQVPVPVRRSEVTVAIGVH